MKNIKTTRFGEIEIDESRVIHFSEGLLGFPEYKDYIILEHAPGSPFRWLQSITDSGLAFVITNPFLIKSDYLENLSSDQEALFSHYANDEIMVFALVTIPHGKAKNATINLLGPIVIDPESGNARQVILANSGYNHRHLLVQ
ncbi:flagellar assembly protein FliW [Deltaproteobacteria bacterium]|nr:flagellar assembly protein FliW [Deltaproteobacteria bacterium]